MIIFLLMLLLLLLLLLLCLAVVSADAYSNRRMLGRLSAVAWKLAVFEQTHCSKDTNMCPRLTSKMLTSTPVSVVDFLLDALQGNCCP
jgi:hypothetical protein